MVPRSAAAMYYFFFSYSRSDNNEYLIMRSFYADLDEAVRDKVGGVKVSFFDQSGNEPGDAWEENLERALSTSRAFIAMATASYCKCTAARSGPRSRTE
jgi:hypothetical protein